MAELKLVSSVSGDGGPLLIADAFAIRAWRGMDEGGLDWAAAQARFGQAPQAPGFEIPLARGLAEGRGVLWNMGESGIVDVYTSGNKGAVLLRTLSPNAPAHVAEELATLAPQQPQRLGTLRLLSGALAVVWAGESGLVVELTDGALAPGMTDGTYECLHDEVETRGVRVRRCHVLFKGV
jgi:hypothetical protein